MVWEGRGTRGRARVVREGCVAVCSADRYSQVYHRQAHAVGALVLRTCATDSKTTEQRHRIKQKGRKLSFSISFDTLQLHATSTTVPQRSADERRRHTAESQSGTDEHLAQTSDA